MKPTEKILIIDDDENMRHIFNLYLTQYGYRVEEAESGEVGLTRIRSCQRDHDEKIDLVLLDYLMPGMDGIAVFNEIQKIDRWLPVIMVTSHSNVNLAVRFMQSGGANFVEKPFDPLSKVLHIQIEEAIYYQKTKQSFHESMCQKGLDGVAQDRQGLAGMMSTSAVTPWKILVACQDQTIHSAISAILQDFSFAGQTVELLKTTCAEGTMQILQQHADMSVVLLDSVMENAWSGFQIVSHIRTTFANRFMRIIMLIGRNNLLPGQKIIDDYDIDGFCETADLNPHKVMSMITLALRVYRDIMLIAEQKREIIEKTTRLEQSEQVVLRVLQNLQHETGTPAHLMISYLSLARRSFNRGEMDKVDQNLVMAIKNSKRLRGYLEDLSLAAHLFAGKTHFIFQEWDLCVSLDAAIEIYAHRMHKRDIQVEMTGEETLPGVFDRRLVEKALTHLLDNAVKFSPEQGKISISCGKGVTAKGQPTLFVTIRDAGQGIPEAESKSIFDPFRESSLTASPSGGKGLGLTIVQWVAKGHGGQVTADNHPAGGARFDFMILAQN